MSTPGQWSLIYLCILPTGNCKPALADLDTGRFLSPFLSDMVPLAPLPDNPFAPLPDISPSTLLLLRAQLLKTNQDRLQRLRLHNNPTGTHPGSSDSKIPRGSTFSTRGRGPGGLGRQPRGGKGFWGLL